MKISLALGPRRPLDRATAWGCLTSNLAIPGCGTLVAGRMSGYFQMVIAMAGMVLTAYFGIKFIGWYVANWSRLQAAQPDIAGTFEQLWLHLRWPLLGFAVFGAGWLWGLTSGLCIVAESKKPSPAAPPVLNP